MKNALAKKPDNDGALLERVLIQGDLKALNEQQRVSYYTKVCESVGLNPLTKPFEYITLNGKLVLYALRACTDQLRKIHKVSVTISQRERLEDVYVVTARASTPDGRTDESTGAVSLSGLKGENLANALMKAETKAKRRVTLSICGLSMLDETEVETVPGAKTLGPVTTKARTLDEIPYDKETGEVLEPAPPETNYQGFGPAPHAHDADEPPMSAYDDDAVDADYEEAEDLGSYRVPFGKHGPKDGKPGRMLRELEPRTIGGLIKYLREAIDDPDKQRWAANNRSVLEKLENYMASRARKETKPKTPSEVHGDDDLPF